MWMRLSTLVCAILLTAAYSSASVAYEFYVTIEGAAQGLLQQTGNDVQDHRIPAYSFELPDSAADKASLVFIKEIGAASTQLFKATADGEMLTSVTLEFCRSILLLAGMLASAIAAGTLINYQFKTVVMSVFGDADERTAFIAVFFLAVLAVSTVFHVVTTGGVLKKYGIRWAISFAPAFLLLSSASVFVIPAGLMLAWVLASRGGDKVFDNTLSQSVRELLYVPVRGEVNTRPRSSSTCSSTSSPRASAPGCSCCSSISAISTTGPMAPWPRSGRSASSS